jgi:GNAT superfamily N-acetyltransferase
MDPRYSLHTDLPTIDEYLRLRRVSGLSPRSETAARVGLPQTAAAAVVRCDGQAVGMGRAIGDGLFYLVVDIAVDPEHQGQGLGKAIVGSLMAALRTLAPAEAYTCLIADGKANELYAQFGFEPTAPASIGMAQWLNR